MLLSALIDGYAETAAQGCGVGILLVLVGIPAFGLIYWIIKR